MKKYLAEMIGTFVLVLMGCGSAIFAGIGLGTTGYGVTTLGVAFAFGLSVIAMAYTIGNISGCHINPAITLGVWANGRMKGAEAVNYMIFQVIGAIIASAVLYVLVHTGNEAGVEAVFNSTTTTGANSFMPGKYSTRIYRRGSVYFHICARSARHHRRKEGCRQLCRSGHRSYPRARPHRMYPHHRHIGQSGPFGRPGHLCSH